MSDVLGDLEEIDGVWLTKVLQGAGIARGAKVLDVVCQGYVGTGQAGRVARLELSWDEPGERPVAVMAKVPCVDPGPRGALFGSGTYLREFVFYQQVAHRVDIRSPRCYYAEYDGDAQNFVLLLEDIEGAVAGDQLAGLSVDQVALAVGQAVKLHAPRWGDTAMDAIVNTGQTVSAVADIADFTQALFAAAAPDFLDRFSTRLDGDVIELIQRFAPQVGKLAYGLGSRKTVVHNDFRADNLLFRHTAEGPQVTVIDYQSINVGFGAGDIAYLIAGSFADSGQRAAAERDLVGEYHAQLRAAGILISAETVWRDYRFGSLWGVLTAVAASLMAERTERGEAMLAEMAQRHGRQALDLDALDLFQ